MLARKKWYLKHFGDLDFSLFKREAYIILITDSFYIPLSKTWA